MTSRRHSVLLPIHGSLLSSLAHTAEPIDLGSRRELFVDHHVIGHLDGVDLRLHRPETRGPAFIFDKPWEDKYSAIFSMFRDGDGYRVYYRGQANEEELRSRSSRRMIPPPLNRYWPRQTC